MQHAGNELGPHRYDATLRISMWNSAHTIFHNTRARGRSRRGTLSKMASFIVDSCRDQRFSLETWDGSKNDRLVSMHTSDHRRSVWYKNERLHTFLRGARSFTEDDDEFSKIAYERFLV